MHPIVVVQSHSAYMTECSYTLATRDMENSAFASSLLSRSISGGSVYLNHPELVQKLRLYGTFSNYIFTEETRCAGCSYTSSGWFKRIEPPLIITFSNHIMTEITGRVEFFHMSSGWFDCTEPSLTIYIFTTEPSLTSVRM